MAEAASKAGKESKNNNDAPPQLKFNLPSLRHIKPEIKEPKDVTLPVDIVLLTVKNYEFVSCYVQLMEPFQCYYYHLGPVYFGKMGEGIKEKLKVALMMCSEGTANPGSSLITITNTLSVMRPKAVISVGACSGLKPETTKLGDVVVSAKLTTYASKIVTSKGDQSTGTRSSVSKHFLDLISYAAYGWEPPLKDSDARDVKVHCDAEVLSGPELVRDEKRRKRLATSNPRAIAIEREGEGVFTAGFTARIEYLLVKGIADYADGKEGTSGNWNTFASVMAASVVANILRHPVVFQEWEHYKGVSPGKDTSDRRLQLKEDNMKKPSHGLLAESANESHTIAVNTTLSGKAEVVVAREDVESEGASSSRGDVKNDNRRREFRIEDVPEKQCKALIAAMQEEKKLKILSLKEEIQQKKRKHELEILLLQEEIQQKKRKHELEILLLEKKLQQEN